MKENLKIPSHIAIILDGNGRWAKLQGKPRSFGHKVGFDRVKSLSIYASKIGVKALSLYCFSTENWNRPDVEVKFLMSIPGQFESDIEEYIKNNIRVIVSGRKDRVPKATLKSLDNLVNKTKDCTGMIVNICFDYGELNDVYNTVNYLVDNNIKLKDEKDIYNYLSTKELPLIDLLIRTGGELRLSNFLLLEASYAELYFTKVSWPEFNEDELDKAIEEYNNSGLRRWCCYG